VLDFDRISLIKCRQNVEGYTLVFGIIHTIYPHRDGWWALHAGLSDHPANVDAHCVDGRQCGLSWLLLDIPRGFEDIYPHFKPLQPGDFRALMQVCDRKTLDQNTVLTREGAPQDNVYFIIHGIPTVTKLGTSFALAERVFVGEVAYLTGKGSAATTSVPAGAEVLVWNVAKLRRAAERKPQLQLALDAVISQDLARKVALAVAPAAQQIGRDQAAQSG